MQIKASLNICGHDDNYSGDGDMIDDTDCNDHAGGLEDGSGDDHGKVSRINIIIIILMLQRVVKE